MKKRGFVLGIVTLLATLAYAHRLDLSLANFKVTQSTVVAQLVLPYNTLNLADDDRDGLITPQEVQRHREDYHKLFSNSIVLKDGSAVALMSIEPNEPGYLQPNVTGDPKSHASLRLVFQFATPVRDLQIHYAYFPPQVNDRCIAVVEDNGHLNEFTFSREHNDYRVESLPRRFRGFFSMGLHHLVTGIDHMLFLAALICLSSSLWELTKTVTAFTVGHSLSLLVAALGIATAPASLVEPLIAVSIIYAGLENLWLKDTSGRWKIALGFGLVHGLGFADALTSLRLEGASLAAALTGFNLGVEAGQIAVVALLYPLIRKVASGKGGPQILRGASIAVSVVATFWFIERVRAAMGWA